MGNDTGSLEGRAPYAAARPTLRRRGVIAAALMALLVGVSGQAAAEENKGYAVSPALQEMSLRTDQSQAEYTLTVANHSTAAQMFRLSALDFGALDESGGVAFLGEAESEIEHKYGLASWMKLGQDGVSVPAGGSVGVRVVIDNRESLAPGGHYGAVLATAVTEPSGVASAPRVGVKQVLSSLILLVKDGGGLPDLRLVSQDPAGSWWRLPVLVEHRFQNMGRVHAVPRGVVSVRDPMGRVVTRGGLNEGSGTVLPESFRRYKTPLTAMAVALLPGRYEVATVYRYDGADSTKTMVTGFWYGGSPVVWSAAVFVIAAGAGLWWWLRRRRAS